MFTNLLLRVRKDGACRALRVLGASAVLLSASCLDLNTGPSTVVGFPVITTQPTSHTVALGDPATFSITATGDSLSYQWYKGTTPIAGANGSTFTIASTVVSDAGTYQVYVANAAATIVSDTVSLVVVVPQVIIGYKLVGGTASATNQGYGSVTADESAVTVSGGGNLTLINATITKSGNASSLANSSQTGANAAVRVESGGVVTMVGSTVKTDSAGATGVFATQGSNVELHRSAVATTGASAYGVAATLGSTILLDQTSIRARSDTAIRATGSSVVSLTVVADSLVGSLVADASSTISGTLQNGATLSGAVQGAGLTIDATSTWNVRGASAVMTLSLPGGISGTSITNIIGNGFTVSYLASLPGNAALGGKTYVLAGGGQLVPR
jgi:hypothetical protein